MGRLKHETLRFQWQGVGPDIVVQPGAYHAEGKWAENDCQELDSDDGCQACQGEMDEIAEMIFARCEKQDRDVMDLILVNRPQDDGYWEYEVWTRVRGGAYGVRHA